MTGRGSVARSARLALVVLAILEALLILGVVVPSMLRQGSAGARPHVTTGELHD